ncbi:MAG: hypothetical protein Q4B18_07805, partial [Bacillota bacterium]|nr:hypothetical protein [Bacillota bacterium]
MRKLTKVLIAIMILVLSMGVFTGCGGSEASATTAGTLVLKVNPEFEIDYDEKGNVVAVMPMNEDAANLMEEVEAYEGKAVSQVIPNLVQLMDDKGFIEKDKDGNGKDINIEVKYGSMLPSDDFLDDIIVNVKGLFDDKEVAGKVIVTGESNYGLSQYDISDYGKSAYDATDYDSSNYATGTSSSNKTSGASSNTDYSDYGSNTNYSNYDSTSN